MSRNLLLVAYICLVVYLTLPALERAQVLDKLSDFFKGVAYRSGKVAIRLEQEAREEIS